MDRIRNKSNADKLDFTIYNKEDAKVFIDALREHNSSIDFSDGRDIYRLYYNKKFYFYSITAHHTPMRLSRADAINCVRNAHIDILITGKLTEESDNHGY